MQESVKIKEIFYPESDGKPMAETDLHRDLMFYMIEILREAFPDSYVSGNICLYYDEGNPKAMISPDVLLSLNGKPSRKRIYKTWEDEPIDLIMEISSRGTKNEDFNKKKYLYAEILRVPGYIIINPENKKVTVFNLKGKIYHEVNKDFQDKWHIKNADLYLVRGAPFYFRFLDSQGNPLLTSTEKEARRANLEAQRAEAEAQRADVETQRAEKAIKENEKIMDILKKAGIKIDNSL